MIKMQITVHNGLTRSSTIIQGGPLNKEANQNLSRNGVIPISRTERFIVIALDQVHERQGMNILFFSFVDMVRRDASMLMKSLIFDPFLILQYDLFSCRFIVS